VVGADSQPRRKWSRRLDDALALCAHRAAVGSDAVVATAANRVAENGRSGHREIRVRGKQDDAIARHPRHPVTLHDAVLAIFEVNSVARSMTHVEVMDADVVRAFAELG